MNVFKILFLFPILLTISPLAMGTIYKCDGPDGPIYSDMECGPAAATVKVSDSAGLNGDYDSVRSDLAEKKSARDQDRGLSKNNNVIKNQPQTYTSEPNGRWLRGRERIGNGEKPSQPIAKPAKPRTGGGRRK